jgi:hypothetical protein
MRIPVYKPNDIPDDNSDHKKDENLDDKPK